MNEDKVVLETTVGNLCVPREECKFIRSEDHPELVIYQRTVYKKMKKDYYKQIQFSQLHGIVKNAADQTERH